MLAISLIISGLLLRFIPHAPNFTPVAAIALFSGTYLNKRYAFLVPLILMIVSDIIIGLHNVIAFTWVAFALITLMGLWIRENKSGLRIIISSLAASLLFFVVSNFGVWCMGWYPADLQGFLTCYIMALPFLRDFTTATLVYSVVFFGIYELVASLVKDKKIAKVILT